MRGYSDTHYKNQAISYVELAREMVVDTSVHPVQRAAMMLMLQRRINNAKAASVLMSSMTTITNTVHGIEDDWVYAMSCEPKMVHTDLADWIEGKKVGEATSGYACGTSISTDTLKLLVFETLALKFTLVVYGQDVIIDKAIRHNPKAASIFV